MDLANPAERSEGMGDLMVGMPSTDASGLKATLCVFSLKAMPA